MKTSTQTFMFFFAIIGLTLLLSYILLRPFIPLILISIVIALIYHPVYKKLERRFKGRSSLAANATLLVILLTIVIPLTVILGIVTTQVISISNDLSQKGTISASTFDFDQVIAEINNFLATLPLDYQLEKEQVAEDLEGLLAPIGSFAVHNVVSIGSNALNILTGLIVFISVVIGVLINYEKLIEILHAISPLPNEVDRLYFERLAATSTAMVKGTFIVALLQGLATGIFLWIGGVDYIALWVVLAVLFSFIPLGAGVVVFPIAIAQLISGSIWQGVFLILTYAIITSNIDNIVRPKLIPENASLHPALTIISLLAGLQAFGFFGIVFGPMVMILVVTTLEVYVDYFKGRVHPKKTLKV